MRGFHTAALFAVVALALCAGGAADTNTPQARGTGASNIGTADSRLSLNITTAAERPQGSDSDELTRGRRPNSGGNSMNSYRDKHHGNKHKQKPETPAWCKPGGMCMAHSDCHKLYPCQETYCKDGKCVCEGKKTGPCIPKPGDVTECTGPLGKCKNNGVCKPLNTDNGCPCSGNPSYRECIKDFDENDLLCVNPLQSCKCGSGGEKGKCIPNYLPIGTTCDLNDGPCKVGKCNSVGACISVNADFQTPCYNTAITCPTAGICIEGECDEIGCFNPPSNGCMEAGDKCEIGSSKGTCCPFSPDPAALVCRTDLSPGGKGKGTCPCFDQAEPCVFKGKLDGVCCVTSNEELVCKEQISDCEVFDCKNVFGIYAGCSPNSCGGGNSDCAEACSEVSPNPTCVADEPKKCDCKDPGKGNQFQCDASNKQSRCCICKSAEL